MSVFSVPRKRPPGAFQEGCGWKIPMNAVKPADGRFGPKESLFDTIDRKTPIKNASRKAEGLVLCRMSN